MPKSLRYAYAHSVQCSLGSNHPDYVVALTNQADVYRDKGDLVQAERHYGQAAREAQVLLRCPVIRKPRRRRGRTREGGAGNSSAGAGLHERSGLTAQSPPQPARQE